MKNRKYLVIILFAMMSWVSSQKAQAQIDLGYSSNWYVGMGLGVHQNSMKFSELDDERFPSSKGLTSPVYSVFLQGEFGTQHQFVIRPQLSFLTRGGKLTEIEKYGKYSDTSVEDIFYGLKANYVDFRLPLIYQLGKAISGVRPYIGVTPIVAFPTSGKIRLQEDFNDFSYMGYHVDLNKSNIASTYLAVAPTVGVRFNFCTGRQAQNVLFVGLEASYEIGLSDTYGADEKDGKAIDVLNGSKFKFDGNRKFSGFEIHATLGIPFSAFKRSKAPVPVVYDAPITPIIEKEPEVFEEKPCHTLEEITDMIARNEDVSGKVICAVDAINFDYGESTIKAESFAYLDKLVETLLRTKSTVVVKGHTDNIGSDKFNMNLSKKRAQSVVKYLIKKGLPKNRLSYKYYGASRPIRSNDTDEGRTYNRRVEFELQK